jgi:hypothetical protein
LAKPTLTAEEQAAVNEVVACQKEAEDYTKTYRRQCDERFAHYRGYKGLQSDMRLASPPDRDTLLRDAQEEWGTDLVVPFAFSTVETVVPRVVATIPKLQVLPKDDDAEGNSRNMRELLGQQQERIQYDLKLEESAKSGFIYGLGIQKLYWVEVWGERPTLVSRPMFDPQTQQIKPMWTEGPLARERIFDDWTVEDIDLRDSFWDPFGYFFANYPGESGSLRYFIHRTWRDHGYVLDRIRQNDWSTEAAQVLEEEDVKALASQKYGEAHQQSQSLTGMGTPPRNSRMHEVWEFHGDYGDRIVTVLDRQIPVVMGKNTTRHKQMPFSGFRPSTAGVKQLPGIGVIEPIEQLLREMSTLRSQRRDNAALKLAQVFAYSDGAIDVNDLQFFPGAAIPVHGEPKDFLYPVQVGDIPNSSYQEEDRIVGDIERTTGISDTLTGTDAAQSSTATGHQLVQAAASIRIARQTRRLEVEMVMREAGQAAALNQQMVVRRQSFQIQVERTPQPGELGPVFGSVELTPPELMGRFAFDVEGGSTAPKNMPQQIQLAQSMHTQFEGDQHIDQRMLRRRELELFGVSHPDSFMAAEEPVLSPAVLDKLAKMGVDPQLIQTAVAQDQRENPPEGTAQGQSGPPDASQAPQQAAA